MATGPVRVTFVINEMLLGGAQKLLLDLLQAFRPEDLTPSVVTLKDEALLRPGVGTYYAELDGLHVPVRRLAGGRRTTVRELLGLRSAIAELAPDVVHTHLPYADILGRLAARSRGVPVVGTLHNFSRSYPRHVRMLERLTMPLAAATTCIYDEIEREEFGSVRRYRPGGFAPGRRSYTVYNGVDTARIRQRRDAADRGALRASLGLGPGPVVCMVGRMVFWKGHRFLVEAMPSVRAAVPDAQLLLVGYGSIEAELKQQAASLGVADAVVFTGARSDVPEILSLADVFAAPYTHEPGSGGGFGVTFAEAMAAEVPVVSTYGPGIEILVRSEETGLLVPPMQAQPLAEAIVRLLRDDALRGKLVSTASEVVERDFSTQAQADTFLDLYRHVARR